MAVHQTVIVGRNPVQVNAEPNNNKLNIITKVQTIYGHTLNQNLLLD